MENHPHMKNGDAKDLEQKIGEYKKLFKGQFREEDEAQWWKAIRHLEEVYDRTRKEEYFTLADKGRTKIVETKYPYTPIPEDAKCMKCPQSSPEAIYVHNGDGYMCSDCWSEGMGQLFDHIP